MREFIDVDNDSDDERKYNCNLPCINVEIKNLNLIALLDTGAEVSLINESIVNNNPTIFQRNIVKISKVKLVNANGKKFAESNKVININFKVKGNEFNGEFVIMTSMKFDVIIGEDILRKLRAKIDLGTRNLELEKIMVMFIEPKKLLNSQVNDNLIASHMMQRDTYEINFNSSEVKLDVSENYEKLVSDLLKKYKSLINFVPRIANGYIHHLTVDENKTFRCKAYPIPYNYRNQIKLEIQNMLQAQIIETSKTNYINPLVIVKKKDDTIRLCLDARKLNEITKSQFDAPQTIDTMLARIGKNAIFTKLDLKNSFWLIPLAAESRKYTGFTVDGHIYQFKVVPFGLQSASSALVRAMQQILDKYEDFCFHYIDDILIFSENKDEHINHLKIILGALDDAGLKLNIEKCQFYKQSVKYLGYKIGQAGISIEKERLDEIKQYPRPKNLRMLRGFLGVLNYYKKFIPKLSELEVPLVELLRKEVKWVWTERRDIAFNNLKQSFHENLLLCSPDFSLPFIVRTDASEHSVAAELTQIQSGVETPICFISRILKPHEVRYAICEKEMASIIFALTRLKYYLTAAHFTLETDHLALAFLMNNRFANNRIYRWSLLIQEYSFDIKHRPGKENVTADAFSRNTLPSTTKPNQFIVALNSFSPVNMLYSESQVFESQKKLTHIRQNIQRKQIHQGYIMKDSFIKKKILDDELYALDPEYTKTIVKDLHIRYGHIGVRKTWLIFREHFYAEKDLKIIKQMVRECEVCCLGKTKNHTNKNEIGSIVTSEPLEIVAIDYVSNLIKTRQGFKHILVITDCFSKFTKAYPTKRCNTKCTIKILKDYCKTIGIPKRLLMDNATYFNNDKFIDHWTRQGVDVIFTCIRHPRANPAERYIQEVLRFLRLTVQDRHAEWEKHINTVEEFLNNVPSTVTEIAPITVMLGQQPPRPWTKNTHKDLQEIRDIVRKRLKRNAEKYLKRENKKIKNRVKFELGNLVVIKRLKVSDNKNHICAKLLFPYEGPYLINKVINNNTYELKYTECDRIRGKFHVEMIYPYPHAKMKV